MFQVTECSTHGNYNTPYVIGRNAKGGHRKFRTFFVSIKLMN